jgi:hypothetical protein
MQYADSADHVLALSLLLNKMDLAMELLRFDIVKDSDNSMATISTLAPYETVYSLLFRNYSDEDIEYFIDAGYNPNEMEPYLFTSVLHLAIDYENVEIFSKLLQAGANPYGNIQKYNNDTFDFMPPLYYALEKRKYNFAELLLQFGVDINSGYEYMNNNCCIDPPIVYFADNKEITSWLVEHGVDPERITE